MIGFITLIVFMFVAFGLTTLFRKWLDVPTLIAVAIGSAVNANLFTSINNPIYIGELVFSMENILSVLFMYTVIVRILDYGYKQGRNMTITTIAAIIISALIELTAKLAYNGYSIETLKNFFIYLFSCIGSIAGVWVMVLITIGCRKKNVLSYLIILLALIAGLIVHSVFYYGGVALIEFDNIFNFNRLLGAVILKLACILLAVFCYFINKKYLIPNNLKKTSETSPENKQNK